MEYKVIISKKGEKAFRMVEDLFLPNIFTSFLPRYQDGILKLTFCRKTRTIIFILYSYPENYSVGEFLQAFILSCKIVRP